MSPDRSSPPCPACGTRLTDAAWADGVCPDCRSELSSNDSNPPIADAEAPTLLSSSLSLAAGQHNRVHGQ